MDWASIFFFLFVFSVFAVIYNRFLLNEKKRQLDTAITLLAAVLSQEQNKDERKKYELLAFTQINQTVLTHYKGTQSELEDQLYVMKRAINLINN